MNEINFFDYDGLFILSAQVHNGIVRMTANLFRIAEYRSYSYPFPWCGYLTEMYGQPGDEYITV